VVGGRRYTFDEALSRRLKELEATLDTHQDAIAVEAQRWLTDIERAARELLDVLAASAADKTAEIRREAAEQRWALDREVSARLAQLDQAAGPRFGSTVSDNAPKDRIEDFREAVQAHMALLEDLTRLDAAASELENARAAAVDALRRSMEALGRDVVAALEDGPVDPATAASLPVQVRDGAASPAIHWSAPPGEPLPG